jgi:hypothetical protein
MREFQGPCFPCLLFFFLTWSIFEFFQLFLSLNVFCSVSEKKDTPGWREVVKPFRDQAYFWHQVWQSCGRALNTEVHNVMKRSRNKHHYEYKKCRKAEERIKRSKLLDACLTGEGDLFSELKKLRQTRSVVATSMDGVISRKSTNNFTTQLMMVLS